MCLLAMYIPKIHSLSAWLNVSLTITVAVVAILFAIPRYGAVRSSIAIFCGWGTCFSIPLLDASARDLGGYGDICRSLNSVNWPDWVFSVFILFDLCVGTLFSLAGIAIGLIVAATLNRFRRTSPNKALETQNHQPELTDTSTPP